MTIFADAMLTLIFVIALGVLLTWASENNYI